MSYHTEFYLFSFESYPPITVTVYAILNFDIVTANLGECLIAFAGFEAQTKSVF